METLSDWAQVETSSSETARILERKARILEEVIEDHARAAEAWERVLAHAVNKTDAYRALEALHMRFGDLEQVCDVLRRQWAARRPGREPLEVAGRLASLLEEDRGQPRKRSKSTRIC